VYEEEIVRLRIRMQSFRRLIESGRNLGVVDQERRKVGFTSCYDLND
jgi:hypothetical protein